MKKLFGASISSVVMLIAGICLIFNPSGFVSWLFYIIGALAIAAAVIKFIAAYKDNRHRKASVTCIGLLILGMIFIIMQKSLIDIIPVVVGICLLVYGLTKLIAAFKFKEISEPAFKKLAAGAIIQIILSVLVIVFAVAITNAVFVFIGIVLVFNAIENIFSTTVASSLPDKNDIIHVESEDAE